jgi:hypothetical protein
MNFNDKIRWHTRTDDIQGELLTTEIEDIRSKYSLYLEEDFKKNV